MTVLKYCAITLTVLSCCTSVSAVIVERIHATLVEMGHLWYQASGDLVNTVKTMSLAALSASPWTLVAVPVAAVILYYLYLIIFAPLNRVRLLEDVGYAADGRLSKKDVANMLRQRRKHGDVPPVYPNGWFAILESRMLSVGQSTSVTCLGLTLAVFRDQKGHSHVIDGHCPHLGANMGIGGRVFDDCIECPFHGWKFRGEDGVCTDIPYLDGKIPSFAKVKSYQVLELNGFIHIWYHAEGEEPMWTPPELEGITTGKWAYRGRTEHYVNAHIEEIPENGADIAHLTYVHEPFIMAGSDISKMWSKVWDFGKHIWKGEWRPDEEKHMGSLWLKHSVKLVGFQLSALDMKVRARQIGPSLVYLSFSTPFGEGVYIHTVLPVEPMLQKMTHNIYFTWYIPPIVPKFFLLAEALMIERDIMIWNHKQYQKSPMMVKSFEDQLLTKHRRWYSQFYSKNSPRLTFEKKSSLDW